MNIRKSVYGELGPFFTALLMRQRNCLSMVRCSGSTQHHYYPAQIEYGRHTGHASDSHLTVGSRAGQGQISCELATLPGAGKSGENRLSSCRGDHMRIGPLARRGLIRSTSGSQNGWKAMLGVCVKLKYQLLWHPILHTHTLAIV